MKVLVTGGAGFIGNEVSLRLTREGHDVVTVDNINDYYDVNLKEARIKRLPKGVVLVRADIADHDELSKVFEEHGPFDKIVHLAAQAGVRYSLENPHVYAQTNYVGTLNILELARAHGNPHVINTSSSSIYGMRSTVPFKENARSEEPVSMYAATKLASELLSRAYVHLYDMHITSIRPFTVYGPWGRPDMAPILFANAITNGTPLPLFNSGDMLRDFSYIDDVVDGFVRAMNAPSGYSVYNIGRGSPMPLMDFIGTLEDAFGKKAKIDNKPMQPGDVYQTYADITRARKDLGYDPRVDVKEGVAAFADWYRDYYKV